MGKVNGTTEEELQSLLQHKDTRHQGFAIVVKQYSQQVYWQLRRMVYDHDNANDLVQNTFIKAWEGLDSFRGESKISTWLYRIALYEGLNFLKQEQRKQSLYIQTTDEEGTMYLMDRLEADEYFDGDYYEKQFQEAIVKLPDKQQQVFRMRYYDDLSYEDISRITGTSVGALKASYHHAVKKIESLLGEVE